MGQCVFLFSSCLITYMCHFVDVVGFSVCAYLGACEFVCVCLWG